jgi:hypothetical protein
MMGKGYSHYIGTSVLGIALLMGLLKGDYTFERTYPLWAGNKKPPREERCTQNMGV